MTRTVAAVRGSVIAGNLPRVDQSVTPAQRQIGKAALRSTDHAHNAAVTAPADSTENRHTERPTSDAVVNRSSTKPLTDRQRTALDFIASHIGKHGFPPTFREIASALNIRSTNGVADHLRALERKGYIQREDMQSRAIRLTSHQEPLPAKASTLINVDREALASVLEGLEGLEDWIPRPMAERYKGVLADLRVVMFRGVTK